MLPVVCSTSCLVGGPTHDKFNNSVVFFPIMHFSVDFIT